MTCPQGSENMNSYSEVIFIINQKLSDWRHFETQYWQHNEENSSFEPKWVNISPEIVFGEDDLASQFILYLLSSTSSEHHHEIENRYGIHFSSQMLPISFPFQSNPGSVSINLNIIRRNQKKKYFFCYSCS